jgi:hypothetical protein
MMGEGLPLPVTGTGSEPPGGAGEVIPKCRDWATGLSSVNMIRAGERSVKRMNRWLKLSRIKPGLEMRCQKGRVTAVVVEASKGVPINVAVVNRCWPHGNPACAGRTEHYAGIIVQPRMGGTLAGESLKLRERNSKVVLPSSRLSL